MRSAHLECGLGAARGIGHRGGARRPVRPWPPALARGLAVALVLLGMMLGVRGVRAQDSRPARPSAPQPARAWRLAVATRAGAIRTVAATTTLTLTLTVTDAKGVARGVERRHEVRVRRFERHTLAALSGRPIRFNVTVEADRTTIGSGANARLVPGPLHEQAATIVRAPLGARSVVEPADLPAKTIAAFEAFVVDVPLGLPEQPVPIGAVWRLDAETVAGLLDMVAPTQASGTGTLAGVTPDAAGNQIATLHFELRATRDTSDAEGARSRRVVLMPLKVRLDLTNKRPLSLAGDGTVTITHTKKRGRIVKGIGTLRRRETSTYRADRTPRTPIALAAHPRPGDVTRQIDALAQRQAVRLVVGNKQDAPPEVVTLRIDTVDESRTVRRTVLEATAGLATRYRIEVLSHTRRYTRTERPKNAAPDAGPPKPVVLEDGPTPLQGATLSFAVADGRRRVTASSVTLSDLWRARLEGEAAAGPALPAKPKAPGDCWTLAPAAVTRLFERLLGPLGKHALGAFVVFESFDPKPGARHATLRLDAELLGRTNSPDASVHARLVTRIVFDVDAGALVSLNGVTTVQKARRLRPDTLLREELAVTTQRTYEPATPHAPAPNPQTAPAPNPQTAPAPPQIAPAAAVYAGRWVRLDGTTGKPLPAYVLTLKSNGRATWRHPNLATGKPVTDAGTWKFDDGALALTFPATGGAAARTDRFTAALTARQKRLTLSRAPGAPAGRGVLPWLAGRATTYARD